MKTGKCWGKLTVSLSSYDQSVEYGNLAETSEAEVNRQTLEWGGGECSVAKEFY